MTQIVHGVSAGNKGEPVEVTDVVIPDPGPGEVVIAIMAVRGCAIPI